MKSKPQKKKHVIALDQSNTRSLQLSGNGTEEEMPRDLSRIRFNMNVNININVNINATVNVQSEDVTGENDTASKADNHIN